MAGATPSGATLTNAELEDIIAAVSAIATRLLANVRGRFVMTATASEPARQQAVHEIFEKISELPREKHSAACAVAMMTLTAELIQLQVDHDCQMIFRQEQRAKPWN